MRADVCSFARSAAARAAYIAEARALGVPVRCFRMAASRELAEHLNYYRERMTHGEHRHVPQIAYNVFNKNFEEPALSEGFREIKRINFVLHFPSEVARRLFYQYS